MTPAPSAPLEWGRGDITTLIIAIVAAAFFSWAHRKALHAKGMNCADTLIGIFSSSLSLGPILMILFDPLNKMVGVFNVDLLDLVMREARLTLWFACAIALLNTILSLMKPRAG